ncbi:diacylglycerol O-acyltransferase [Frankia sp. EI5c]|uniref:WS/DGAT domain-containing protein n=1 Tax=Frankia sp. EI5c TaxID=683316 RepID=UPI0007C30676|nr:WS/DGAT domain-containing protein [Frankia sp. EI5c]OAA25853.1 diacylglycerol O-acyltransferase [Frankia sp. EI5c]
MALLGAIRKTDYTPAHVRPLTPGDRAYLAFVERHPGEHQDIGALLHFDGPQLDLAELRAHIAERLRDPRARMLTDRLETVTVWSAERGSTAKETRWVSDPGLNLDDHVVAVDLPPVDLPPADPAAGEANSGVRTGTGAGIGERGGDERLRAAVDSIVSRPVDLTRPPWMLYLLRDPTPGATGTTLVYRSSHVQQDGMALYRVMYLLFGDSDEIDLGLPGTIPRPRPVEYAKFVARGVGCLLPTRRLAGWGGPPAGPARHDWVSVEVGTLRSIARAHGVTVNDVYLAALAGALRAWSPADWKRGSRPVHALMPVSIRAAAERDILSNYNTGARVPLYCAEPDPARRLARIAAATSRMKRGGLGLVERHHFPAMARFASQRMLAEVGSYPTQIGKMALVATNARTIRGPLSVAGRPMTDLIGMGPLLVGRQHLAVAMFGVDNRVGVMFVASESVPGRERLAQLWLDELAALRDCAPRPRVAVPAQRLPAAAAAVTALMTGTVTGAVTGVVAREPGGLLPWRRRPAGAVAGHAG